MDIFTTIEKHVAENGGKTAFFSRIGEISYNELWERSGRIAKHIDDLMGDNKDPIVVYGHKDPMMIVCFLACTRSGRAYCPVDTSMTEERIRQVAGTIGHPLMLSAEAGAQLSSIEDVCRIIGYEEVVHTASEGPVSEDLHPCQGEDDFYIIFTSGTTGRPKGVRITANNLNNYIDWAVSLAGGIREGSTFLNQAPYSFDLSVMDLYLSLATGGTILSVDSGLQKNTKELLGYIGRRHVDYWVSTPSFADLCLADEGFSGSLLSGMKAFLFCGEPLSNRTSRNLIERFPGVKVINTYGPTESTVCVTEIEITKEIAERKGIIPAGRVKPGTKVEIDPETGEIIIIGDTVSAGYYKSPELTSKAFYTDMTEDGHTERAYRTGDKGHLDEEGLLYCEGRIDNQIKLHGYRIEIEDIETNLTKVGGVERAAVAPRMREGKPESLTAFIVRDKSVLGDDYKARKSVRTELGKMIPSYMVPKRIVFIDDLPLTGNGKLDRKKLKEMG